MVLSIKIFFVADNRRQEFYAGTYSNGLNSFICCLWRCVCSSFVGPWSRPTRLLGYRELDDALGLIEMASETRADARTGRNGRHARVGLLRQSVFGRLAGYEDVNDAERLRHDSTMRWIVGGTAAHSNAASPSRARKSFVDLSRAVLQLSCICEPIPRRRDIYRLPSSTQVFACRLVHIRRGLVFGRP